MTKKNPELSHSLRTLYGLNEPIRDLNDDPILEGPPPEEGKRDLREPLLVKNVLANIIITGETKDPVPALSLAIQIRNSEGPLLVSKEDHALVITSVTENQGWTTLVRGRVLMAIESPPIRDPQQ